MMIKTIHHRRHCWIWAHRYINDRTYQCHPVVNVTHVVGHIPVPTSITYWSVTNWTEVCCYRFIIIIRWHNLWDTFDNWSEWANFIDYYCRTIIRTRKHQTVSSSRLATIEKMGKTNLSQNDIDLNNIEIMNITGIIYSPIHVIFLWISIVFRYSTISVIYHVKLYKTMEPFEMTLDLVTKIVNIPLFDTIVINHF